MKSKILLSKYYYQTKVIYPDFINNIILNEGGNGSALFECGQVIFVAPYALWKAPFERATEKMGGDKS